MLISASILLCKNSFQLKENEASFESVFKICSFMEKDRGIK